MTFIASAKDPRLCISTAFPFFLPEMALNGRRRGKRKKYSSDKPLEHDRTISCIKAARTSPLPFLLPLLLITANGHSAHFLRDWQSRKALFSSVRQKRSNVSILLFSLLVFVCCCCNLAASGMRLFLPGLCFKRGLVFLRAGTCVNSVIYPR